MADGVNSAPNCPVGSARMSGAPLQSQLSKKTRDVPSRCDGAGADWFLAGAAEAASGIVATAATATAHADHELVFMASHNPPRRAGRAASYGLSR